MVQLSFIEFNIFDYVYRFDQNAGFDFKDWFDDFNTKPSGCVLLSYLYLCVHRRKTTPHLKNCN